MTTPTDDNTVDVSERDYTGKYVGECPECGTRMVQTTDVNSAEEIILGPYERKCENCGREDTFDHS